MSIKKLSPLSTDDITQIQQSYPPLMEDEFRYSRIVTNSGNPAPNADDPSLLIIGIYKSNKQWNLLSSMTHKCYINHRIPSIPNQAPTIEQWYQELRVYPDELMCDKPPRTINANVLKYDPKPEFFSDANVNFASSKNCRIKKKKGRFAYYYYIEPQTNRVLHLPEPEARQLYCKKFEQSITFAQSPAKPVFDNLWRTLMCRSRNIPIVMRGYKVDDSLDKPLSIVEKYHDFSVTFGDIYCLVEMLLKYPHLDRCIWNTEIPSKTIPKRIPKPKPVVKYNNPHSIKVYKCDRVGNVDVHEIDNDDVDAFVSD